VSAALYPGIFLVLVSVNGYIDPRPIVLLEGLGELKNSIILSGFETATFLLVAYSASTNYTTTCSTAET
jgi:hypothetical protein